MTEQEQTVADEDLAAAAGRAAWIDEADYRAAALAVGGAGSGAAVLTVPPGGNGGGVGGGVSATVIGCQHSARAATLPMPPAGRLATYLPSHDGNGPAAVVYLDGWHTIFRFMVNLLHDQTDIAGGARPVLVDMREHMTPARFDPMARQILGDDWYNRLRSQFERSWQCRGCERDIRAGWSYAPTGDGGAVCARCCRTEPDYAARLVKRPAPAPSAMTDVELPDGEAR